jgi:hypothetical protein
LAFCFATPLHETFIAIRLEAQILPNSMATVRHDGAAGIGVNGFQGLTGGRGGSNGLGCAPRE